MEEESTTANSSTAENNNDIVASSRLIRSRLGSSEVEDLFAKTLSLHPNCSDLWLAWARYLFAMNQTAKLDLLFKDHLLESTDLRFWKVYVQNVRRESRDVKQAYELALEHVGLDYGAGGLWHEYLQSIKDDVSMFFI